MTLVPGFFSPDFFLTHVGALEPVSSSEVKVSYFSVDQGEQVATSHLRRLQIELETALERLDKVRKSKPSDRTAPSTATLADLRNLGRRILSSGKELPKRLNINASDDGSVLLTLFGSDSRSIEIWLEGSKGRATVVGFVADKAEIEKEIAISQSHRLLDWLFGS